MRTRPIGVVVSVVIAMALTACAAEPDARRTVLPTPNEATAIASPLSSPSKTVLVPSPTISAAPTPCAGGTVTISGGSGTSARVGDCYRVSVTGSGITLDTSAAAIGTLLIQGDNNRVIGAATLTTVTIEGQDNSVDAARAASVTVRGQRNAVTSSEEIGALEISGNDNAVSAPRVVTTSVSGDGNTYPAP
ncbi:DUF3060 domain-containing protein [Microbacterium sp. VKM Ac-2870]|uniref:DUF3060 domain-containing protein n=1 Tax=Microbacterium sp. VKM Ac-2870 TaxID=2783825 RepID=UPI00188C8434|nr:DUF3060 domain-containing protein [Microbacterium sp. VKM Ac-2870]MBF4560724.1 DUF3060 domain-containing protein [Microbacterium sp. VKM Ac-2870]